MLITSAQFSLAGAASIRRNLHYDGWSLSPFLKDCQVYRVSQSFRLWRPVLFRSVLESLRQFWLS